MQHRRMPGPDRAGVARVVADRNYEIEFNLVELVPRFAASGRRIDIVNVFQHADRKRIHLPGWSSTRTMHLEAVTAGTPQQVFAEDAPGRIAREIGRASCRERV